jgi:hypothetical protein
LKPAYGSPCNRCGECCKRYPCPVGQALFRQKTGPCPALQPSGECGLMLVEDERLREAARVIIGAGTGCDAQFVGEPLNAASVAARLVEARTRGTPTPAFLEALAAWGIAYRP